MAGAGECVWPAWLGKLVQPLRCFANGRERTNLRWILEPLTVHKVYYTVVYVLATGKLRRLPAAALSASPSTPTRKARVVRATRKSVCG